MEAKKSEVKILQGRYFRKTSHRRRCSSFVDARTYFGFAASGEWIATTRSAGCKISRVSKGLYADAAGLTVEGALGKQLKNAKRSM